MLKFFRRIRKRLLTDGRVGKYVLYALGEILLVVLGILIALQINDRNERIENERIEIKALKDLKKEFVSNAEIFELHLEVKKTIQLEWLNLIQVTSEKIKNENSEVIRHGKPGTSTFIPTQNTLNKLIFTGAIDNIRNDTLKQILNNGDNIYSEYTEDEQFHMEFWEKQFLPYELKFGILPSFAIKDGNVFPQTNPYTSQVESMAVFNRLYSDRHYQNLLLRNHYWIQMVVTEGDQFLNTMKEIIQLLEVEIQSKR